MTAEKKPYLAMASAQELADFAKNNGVESYRAKQIERWVSKRWTVNPDSMTDPPRPHAGNSMKHSSATPSPSQKNTSPPTGPENFCCVCTTASSSNAHSFPPPTDA